MEDDSRIPKEWVDNYHPRRFMPLTAKDVAMGLVWIVGFLVVCVSFWYGFITLLLEAIDRLF